LREIEATDDGSGDPGAKPEGAKPKGAKPKGAKLEGAKPEGAKPARESTEGERADRRGYHHGRLKDALIEAARALIKQRGPAGFSLTEAARLVGVTPAAPYRHFPDRDALMAEVARRGFALFAGRMKTAWDDGRPDAATAFGRMGAAYLDFANSETGYYRAMFTRADAVACSPEIAAESFAALEAGVDAVLRAQGVSEAGARAGASRLALEIWALSHGIATLALGGFLPPKGDGAADLLTSGARALVVAAVRRAKEE
jgi:AcrR family transcriptional regulator